MVIKSLYKDYFQKSRVFLYPALGIKRGVSVTPMETYVSWKGHYAMEDRKLCCLYHLRSDEDFRNFEKTRLLGNPLFHDFKQVDDGKGVYVFDLEPIKENWDHFLKGKYSRFTREHKTRIKAYMGAKSPHAPYVDSFLDPEKYFRLYSDLMNVNERILREVGELCSRPDLDSEILDISVLDLHLNKQMT
jgi:hypothetical protein